jgi:hypothetical protein
MHQLPDLNTTNEDSYKLEGKWVMKGRPAVLVHSSSATHGRPWECEAHHIQPVGKIHSDLVKYSVHDGVYARVLHVLQRYTKSAVTVIRDRSMGKEGTTFSSSQHIYV